jgi:hypothetical protein
VRSGAWFIFVHLIEGREAGFDLGGGASLS